MYVMIILKLLYLLCIIVVASTTERPDVSAIENHINWRHLDRKNCGRTRYDNLTGRIIDGKEARLGQFPWLVRIGLRLKKILFFACAGSLLNRYYVLSAAHCGDKNTIVRLGEHNVVTSVDCESNVCAHPVQDINIKKYLFFDYNRHDHTRDFSIILLEKPAVYNDFVRPVCLPHGKLLRKSFIGENVKIAGWGYTDAQTLDQPEMLMYMVAPVLAQSVCDAVYAHTLDETQFCIGYEHENKDSCSGDSGGPVTKYTKASRTRQHFQIAIVSYGLVACGHGPAVYTNILYYMPVILDNIVLS